MKKIVFLLGGWIFLLSASFLVAEEKDIEIKGFVDSSFFADLNAKTENFGLDQVELNIIKETDKVSLRGDIEFTESMGAELEQGFVTFICPSGSGITYQFGKFNAPIGFELLDAPDMFQYSHALVFDYGLPTNLSGFMLSRSYNEMLDVSIYIVNGWDINADNNDRKTFGGRLGMTPVKDFNFGISLITGPEKVLNENDKRTVFDLDATFTGIKLLTLGAEINIGSEDKASGVKTGDDADWLGFLLMGHYDYTDWSGITLRYDFFDDKDGSRIVATAQKQTAITISPTFTVGDGLGALIEYRRDSSDKSIFTDENGNPTDSQSGLAVEFTYSF